MAIKRVIAIQSARCHKVFIFILALVVIYRPQVEILAIFAPLVMNGKFQPIVTTATKSMLLAETAQTMPEQARSS